MNRPRRIRPTWTIGTLLIVVAWSSAVVWLNIRPRTDSRAVFTTHTTSFNPPVSVTFTEEYGWPFTVAVGFRVDKPPARQLYPRYKKHLAGNAIIGMMAVAVLTFLSKYLLNRIMFAFRFRTAPDRQS